MFVLFYLIQSCFNYFFRAFNETSEFYRDIGRVVKTTYFDVCEFIQCLDCLLDEMYGHGKGLEQNPELLPLVLYENKYLDKYNNLQLLDKTSFNKTSFDKTTFSHRFIIEKTPIGNVIMQYDLNKEAFVYYSDNMIPFRYLETVARKYVCTYNCKELYVERHEILHKDEEEKKPVKTKDLIQLKRNATKPVVSKVEVKMNRYSNLGRFSNFNMLQKVERHVTDKKRLLTFSDFKRQSVVS